jgi:hypothetical protein
MPGAAIEPDEDKPAATESWWQAERDRVRAALHRTSLPVYGGYVRDELAAQRIGGAR